jgi:hypothetical protein
MPTKKKSAPAVIKGPQFSGSSPLNHDDLDALSVDGFGNPAEILLDGINWSRKIVALTGIRLSPDNQRVVNSAVFLLGSLCVDKRVSVTKVWNFSTTTYLTLTVNNANIFTFPNGALQSDYVDSSALSFKFSQSGSTLGLPTLTDLGFKGFCLRAALAPISPTYTKIWVTLIPFAKADLLSTHPLALNPSFPGLKRCKTHFSICRSTRTRFFSIKEPYYRTHLAPSSQRRCSRWSFFRYPTVLFCPPLFSLFLLSTF